MSLIVGTQIQTFYQWKQHTIRFFYGGLSCLEEEGQEGG